MNNDMKFRVWDTKESKWVSANVFINHSGLLFWDFANETRKLKEEGRYIVQQYTGLIDHNGNEIYDGDILRLINKATHSNEQYTHILIRWEDESARWVGHKISIDYGTKLLFANDKFLTTASFIIDGLIVGHINQTFEEIKEIMEEDE